MNRTIVLAALVLAGCRPGPITWERAQELVKLCEARGLEPVYYSPGPFMGETGKTTEVHCRDPKSGAIFKQSQE